MVGIHRVGRTPLGVCYRSRLGVLTRGGANVAFFLKDYRQLKFEQSIVQFYIGDQGPDYLPDPQYVLYHMAENFPDDLPSQGDPTPPDGNDPFPHSELFEVGNMFAYTNKVVNDLFSGDYINVDRISVVTTWEPSLRTFSYMQLARNFDLISSGSSRLYTSMTSVAESLSNPDVPYQTGESRTTAGSSPSRGFKWQDAMLWTSAKIGVDSLMVCRDDDTALSDRVEGYLSDAKGGRHLIFIALDSSYDCRLDDISALLDASSSRFKVMVLLTNDFDSNLDSDANEVYIQSVIDERSDMEYLGRFEVNDSSDETNSENVVDLDPIDDAIRKFFNFPERSYTWSDISDAERDLLKDEALEICEPPCVTSL